MARQIFHRHLIAKQDLILQPGGCNLIFQPLQKLGVVCGGAPHHQGTHIGAGFADLNHRLHKEIIALLVANAAETAHQEPVCRQIERGAQRGLISHGFELVTIHTVANDGGVAFQIAGGFTRGGNHMIHLPDQPAGETGVVALCGRGEQKAQAFAQDMFQRKPCNHFQIAPGMPHAHPRGA